MNRLIIGAGALLLGTSTIALAADVDLSGATPVDKGPAQSGPVVDKEMLQPTTADAKLAEAAAYDAKLASASWSEQTAFAEPAPKPENAALASWSDEPADAKLAMAGDSWIGEPAQPKAQTAALETWSDDPADDKLAMASAETWSDPAADAALPADPAAGTGMGGPLDEGAVTTADLTPRPAAANYPPCEPGPGDDNCIQLYEPGVRAQLASWTAPTGGLADGGSATAMGGPYEPVDETAAPADLLAMTGDGAADPAAVDAGDTTVANHSAYQGVGGPVEAQSGYPPCDPGPGDDRCIQLYERGVTGAGN